MAAAAFFGACALLTLAVSVPATFAALRVFHDDGSAAGWWLAAFALVVFEVGAVGAKLATLAIPEWRGRLTALTLTLLTLTTGANYAHGYDLARAAAASPTLAAVLADARGAVLATACASALFPALLFVFLSAACAQVERIVRMGAAQPARAVSHRPAQLRRLVRRLVARMRQERILAAHHVAEVRALGASMLAPDAPASAPPPAYTCVRCGAGVKSAAHRSASGKWGCEVCKRRSAA